MRRRHGFTLVELLVVIGIIALLISVLMPSLGRARESATAIKCQSNMRQISLALSLYANDNKGFLPRASYANDWGPTGTCARTYIALSNYVARRINDEQKDTLSPMFTCVKAINPYEAATAWNPNIIRTIQFNPRAFPGYDQDNVTYGTEYPQRKLSSVKNSSNKMAFWDGQQVTTWNYTTPPEAINMEGWRWNWGHKFTDPPADNDFSRWDTAASTGANADTNDFWGSSMRFRHFKNTFTSVAFFDGHVESRRLGSVLVKEICINK